MDAVFVRGYNNYDVDAASAESGLCCEEETRTIQADSLGTDINQIVKVFGVTGLMPQGARVPSYRDYEGIFDYQSAQNAIIAAEKSFMALPAEVRGRFRNDPGEFLKFCEDEGNLPELRKMGLAIPEPVKDDLVADKKSA